MKGAVKTRIGSKRADKNRFISFTPRGRRQNHIGGNVEVPNRSIYAASEQRVKEPSEAANRRGKAMSYAIPVQTALETYLSHIQRCHPCAASQFDLFAQDAWRLKPSLTLNYGLRWEWNTPQADAAKQIQAFRPGQATGIFPCVLSSPDPLRGVLGSSDCSPQGRARSVFPLGMVFPGDSECHRGSRTTTCGSLLRGWGWLGHRTGQTAGWRKSPANRASPASAWVGGCSTTATRNCWRISPPSPHSEAAPQLATLFSTLHFWARTVRPRPIHSTDSRTPNQAHRLISLCFVPSLVYTEISR